MDFKSLIFWVLLLVFTLPGFYFGWAKLVATTDKIVHFKRLGIQKGWMQALGGAEIASNLLLFFPQTRLAGMAAWLVILLGANFFNVSKKEPREELYASLGVLALLGILFLLRGWA